MSKEPAISYKVEPVNFILSYVADEKNEEECILLEACNNEKGKCYSVGLKYKGKLKPKKEKGLLYIFAGMFMTYGMFRIHFPNYGDESDYKMPYQILCDYIYGEGVTSQLRLHPSVAQDVSERGTDSTEKLCFINIKN